MSRTETFLEQLERSAAMGTNFGAFAAPSSREIAQQAINKVETVIALPDVTTRILAAVENANTSAAELQRLVSQDPSLVTRILTVVNSSFFGLPGQVDSLQRAIVILGFRGVKNLAIAAGLGQVFRGGSSVKGCTPRNIWAHSVAVAVAARLLAQEMSAPIQEEAFIAGLVHDLGLLVEIQVFPQQLEAVCHQARASAADFCQIERHVIGTDHQWLGEALAARWRFPNTCRVAANYHHLPMAAPVQDRLMASLVHTADTICCQANHGFNLTALHQNFDREGLAQINLDDSTMERAKQKLPQLVKDAADLLA
jgi:HD-like signal output (HDOD) protein